MTATNAALRCILCGATADVSLAAGWATWTLPADLVWVNQLDHTPALIERAGTHPACANCSTWLTGDRQGLPAGTLQMIGDALDQATAAGTTHHQTRRALREELVDLSHALADRLT